MGIKGALKSIGKGALKVGKVAAPIALGMTGVGIPAAMALSGGLNALDKKVSGGSWKQALGAGAMGAGTAALGGGLGGAVKGIGPSGGMLGRIGNVARTAQDVGGAIGAVRGAMGSGGGGGRQPPQQMPMGGGMQGSPYGQYGMAQQRFQPNMPHAGMGMDQMITQGRNSVNPSWMYGGPPTQPFAPPQGQPRAPQGGQGGPIQNYMGRQAQPRMQTY